MFQTPNPKLGGGSYREQEGSLEQTQGQLVLVVQKEQSDGTGSHPSLPSTDACLQAGAMNVSFALEIMGNPFTQMSNYWHTLPDSR